MWKDPTIYIERITNPTPKNLLGPSTSVKNILTLEFNPRHYTFLFGWTSLFQPQRLNETTDLEDDFAQFPFQDARRKRFSNGTVLIILNLHFGPSRYSNLLRLAGTQKHRCTVVTNRGGVNETCLTAFTHSMNSHFNRDNPGLDHPWSEQAKLVVQIYFKIFFRSSQIFILGRT